jgi:hypothetical protein
MFNRVKDKPDARIILDDDQGLEHNVHRIIVAVESPFFECLFKFDRAKNIFHVGVIKKVSMDLFLRFCYHKKLKLTKDNVADLMITANYLGANNIMKKCKEYVIENLDWDRPDFIKEYVTFADDYQLLGLWDLLNDVVQEKIDQLYEEIRLYGYDRVVWAKREKIIKYLRYSRAENLILKI